MCITTVDAKISSNTFSVPPAGEATYPGSDHRGQQHDKDHPVRPLRAGHLVPLPVSRGVRTPGPPLRLRILPQVHEEPDHSQETHGEGQLMFHCHGDLLWMFDSVVSLGHISYVLIDDRLIYSSY